MPSPKEPPLIDLRQNVHGPVRRGLYGLFTHPLEAVLAIKTLNRRYKIFANSENEDGDNFFTKCLRHLNVTYEMLDVDLNRIPKEGPVLIVANHPLGGLDGIVLGAILTSVRPDVRLLANGLLGHIKEIRPWLFSVNPFGGPEATKQNIRGIKNTINYLRDGGCVGTFPSGTVSHLQLRSRQVTDPDWNPNTARFVRMSKATVVPLHFEGKNSAAFHMLGLIHPLLRTVMLPREMLNKQDSTLRVRAGNPIPYRKLASYESDEALTEFLRLSTYVLKDRADPLNQKRRSFPVPLPIKKKKEPKPRKEVPIAAAQDADTIAAEIAALSPEAKIVSNSEFEVYFTQAKDIPCTLLEIGRLRELTFRDVQEGTGKERDLDKFDDYYYHLFMWDVDEKRIVGAYRMGKSDDILAKYGPEGLYTSTLFKFKPGALDYFNPGFELGRSFIVPEYQRKHASLVLMWRAIMRVIAYQPEHHILFGPVSITNEYHKLSKDLMVQFLRNQNYDRGLAACIKPRNPPKRAKLKSKERAALKESLRDIDDVSALISEIETDQKGVPTLLRHYLKLHGQILSFNIDPDFGECMDGLIMVDFTRSNFKLLKQYMGKEGWAHFSSYHNITEDVVNAEDDL